ncbi:leucine-rich repeat protein [Prevotella dentasini]|uniref:leucine-rich repeat protein n=1 Tax=Prevotella dentasini TaxID=589537 RepID=UPI000A011071|nr:leucine-rich repeat protein [Prevotella dentasini]
MKKLFLLLCVMFLTFIGLRAQTVVNGVLTSWEDAQGEIIIPDDVTEIAANCFYEEGEPDDEGWGASDPVSNTNITRVSLNNVTKVGENAFRGCTGIISIDAPKLQNVGKAAFSGCTELTAIDLPVIVSIEKDAFASCDKVTAIKLGNTLTDIYNNPFRGCKSALTLTMPDGGLKYRAVSNALLRKADATLVAFAGGGKDVSLSADDCKAVGEDAFYNIASLEKVTLPGATIIGNNAFVMCSSLSELYVPRLVRVVDDSYFTFSGVGALSIVDIHLSESFETLGYSLADKEQTTIYVANEIVKEKLQKDFKKCNIVVGEPGAVTKYEVNYSCSPEGYGTIEAWTTGAVPVESGNSLNEGVMLKVKATPFFGNQIEKWVVNGKEITEPMPTEGTNGQIYTINALQEAVNVEVIFAKMPESYTVFFKSRQPDYGTITCKTQEGKEVNTAEQVPVGTQLTFTATAFEGYHVTDWYREVTAPDNTSSFEKIEELYGKTTYTCDAYDMMDIRVDFERNIGTNVVKFSSLNEFGTLTATADGNEIVTGAAVATGAKVVFTAHPNEGYHVDSWLLNNEVIVGLTANEYTIESLNADVEVSLVCTQSQQGGDEHKPVVEDGHLVKWLAVGEAVIGDNIIAIDNRAFEGANEMTKVIIGKNVETIGELPFLYCTRLTDIKVQADNKNFCDVDGVLYNKEKTEIVAYPSGREAPEYTLVQTTDRVRPGAFAANFNLAAVNVPSGNTALVSDAGALYSRDGKTLIFQPIAVGEELTVKDGVETIGRLAIAFSPVFKKIFLPTSLKTIDVLGMSYNMILEQFGWKEGVTPALQTIGDNAFERNMSLLQLPYIETLKSIGKNAFLNDLLMEEAHIPAGCTLSTGAFAHCVALKNVYAYAMQPQVIGEETFSDIENISTAVLYVPFGTKELYKAAAGWSRFMIIEEFGTNGIGAASVAKDISISRVGGGYVIDGITVVSIMQYIQLLAHAFQQVSL